MSGKKRRFYIFTVLLLALALTACSPTDESAYEYCELGIRLGEGFSNYDAGGSFSTAYSDGSIIVGITRISFANSIEFGILDTWTPRKLCEVQMEKLDFPSDNGIEMHGDTPYFTYSRMDKDGDTHFYLTSFYRTQYAYFVITFITPEINKTEGKDKFLEYISSVYIIEDYLQ